MSLDKYHLTAAELAELAKSNGENGNGHEPSRPHAYSRPVDVRNGALAADWLRQELGQGQLSGIFRRDDQLVHTPRIGEDGYLPPETSDSSTPAQRK